MERRDSRLQADEVVTACEKQEDICVCTSFSGTERERERLSTGREAERSVRGQLREPSSPARLV